jgi:DNA repair protein RadC
MAQLRLFERGVELLTDEELLSLIVGDQQSARALLVNYGTIHGIAVREAQEFYMFKGIGKFRAQRLTAIFEFSRRLASRSLPPKLKITDPEVIFQHLEPLLSHLNREIFMIMALNSANKLIRQVKISEGILNSSLVHPREIFRPAILESAASIILIHNHPSGEVLPSMEDKNITRRLVEAGRLMDIPILDHIIVGQKQFFSFREAGLIAE